MVHCIELALENPPSRGDRVKILNQMTQTHRVRDLAELIANIPGAEVAYVPNPRKESAENELHVSNDTFLGLGLNPTTLSEGLLHEVEEVAKKYADRAAREEAELYSWRESSKALVAAYEYACRHPYHREQP